MIRGAHATDSTVVSSIDATLNRLRMRGDPLADAVALRLDTPPHLSALPELRFLAKSEIGIYQELLDHVHSIPQHTDFSSLERARTIQLAFHSVRHLAWLLGALPQGIGACPLLHPDQLLPELHRRLAFHTRLNQALTEPNTLHPGHALHEALLQQRLQWALLRKCSREAGWNALEFGEPLNQEYLLLVVLEYGLLTLDAMARLGAPLHPDDQAAVFAFWELAGYWLGLEADIIPRQREDAARLIQRIRWRYSQAAIRQQQHRHQVTQWCLANAPPALAYDFLHAVMNWCGIQPSQQSIRPGRALQFWLTANRGTTLAHYHLPGVGLIREKWHRRELSLVTDSSPNVPAESLHPTL